MGNTSNSGKLSAREAQEIRQLQNEQISGTRGATVLPKLDFSTSDMSSFKPKQSEKTKEVGCTNIPKQVDIGGSSIPDFEKTIEKNQKIGMFERTLATIGLHFVMLAQPISDDKLMSILNFIQSWLSSRDVSFKVLTTQGKDGLTYHQIFGYIFSECTYILFKMEFFRRKSDQAIGLEVQQIEGEGFTLGTFFADLLAEFYERRYAIPLSREASVENETDFGDDDQFFYSSDEESEDNDEDSSMDNIDTHYLELSRSPKIVNRWINKLLPKTAFQDVLNTLLLFSHNCQHEANLLLVIESIKPQWSSFLQLLLDRMNGSNNLPVVKSCCKILYHIFAKVPDFPLGWNDIETLCMVLGHWSTEQPFSYSHPVSICPEIQRYLGFVITSCKTPVDSKPKAQQLDNIQALRNLTFSNSVRLDLNKFLDKLGV